MIIGLLDLSLLESENLPSTIRHLESWKIWWLGEIGNFYKQAQKKYIICMSLHHLSIKSQFDHDDDDDDAIFSLLFLERNKNM